MILDHRIKRMTLQWRCPRCGALNRSEVSIREPSDSLVCCPICQTQRAELHASLAHEQYVDADWQDEVVRGNIDWRCNCGQFNRSQFYRWSPEQPEQSELSCCEPECGKHVALGLCLAFHPAKIGEF